VPPLPGRTVTAQTPCETWRGDATALFAALGGHSSVRGLALAASRLRVEIADAARLERTALESLGLRGVALPRPGFLHLIVGPAAPAPAAALRQLLAP
jgi:phosphotransferase system IIB component